MHFTDSQLIALSTIIENKNRFIRSDLIKSMEKPVRTNFSSEIAIPLEKNKSLLTSKLPKTKQRGRPGSVMRVTSNPWILEDIYQAMNARADRYAHEVQKCGDVIDCIEKKRIYFSKYTEWARRSTLFLVHCLDRGLQFPSPDKTLEDEEWKEYCDVLYGHKIE